MFVQDSAPLRIPVALARDRLLAYLHDDARLQPDTWRASDEGMTLLRCPGVTGVASRVTAHTAPARRRGVSTVIPIWWTVADVTRARTPTLDATLELDPRPDGTSRLTLCGRYLPPTKHTASVERLVIGPAARAAAHSYLAALTRAVTTPGRCAVQYRPAPADSRHGEREQPRATSATVSSTG